MKSHTMVRATLPLLLTAVGLAGARGASAQRSSVVPPETVVRVRLDQKLSSRDATRGDRFTASLDPEDRSGFPVGTRFEGAVTEVKPYSKNEPGLLDMEFRNAVFPDGQRVGIEGTLASLSDEDVRRVSDGRLETRRRNGKFNAKWVGYGAAGGAVLSTIFGGNFLKGALLGGLGGAVYGYLNKDKDKGSYREVELDRGTQFGIRLGERVAFTDRTTYRYAANNDREEPFDGRFGEPVDRRADGRDVDDRDLDDRDRRVGDDRVLGSREEFRYGSTVVRLDGRPVEFGEARPLNLNGIMFVPLAPIAEAANMRFQHRRGEDSFVFYPSTGRVRGYVGETAVAGRDERDARDPQDDRVAREERVETAPISVNGEIYVTTEYLSRVANMRVNWDRPNLRMDIESR